MNFHQLFNAYRAEFSKMHVYRIKTFLVCSLNNEAKYRQLAFIEIIFIWQELVIFQIIFT